MDVIKEAFQKVRSDIDFLNNEISIVKYEIASLKKEMFQLKTFFEDLYIKTITQNNKVNSTYNLKNTASQTYIPTHNLPSEALKPENITFSSGNEGVPTDKQTNRQTDKQQLDNHQSNKNALNSIDNAVQILESLDNIKKEIRLKFKRLTPQEVLIFSTLYQIEESKGYCDYKLLSADLNLTESSIRDYIGRLLRKGIPIEKTRLNNKTVHLSISKNLKKVASLPTILKLREL